MSQIRREPSLRNYATIAALDAAVIGAGNVPAAGGTGEVLAKASTTDFDTEWVTRADLAQDTAFSGRYAPLAGLRVLPAAEAGFGAGCADSAALDVTGDAEWVFHAAMADWSPAGSQRTPIVRGSADPNRAWFIRFNETTVQLVWSPTGSGASNRSAVSTAPAPFGEWEEGWVRVTLDVDNGTGGSDVTFYTSTDGANWTQLGDVATVAGATTGLPAVNAGITIGQTAVGGGSTDAVIFGFEFRDGIDGTLAAQVDLRNGWSRYVDPANNSWTVTNTATIGWTTWPIPT